MKVVLHSTEAVTPDSLQERAAATATKKPAARPQGSAAVEPTEGENQPQPPQP